MTLVIGTSLKNHGRLSLSSVAARSEPAMNARFDRDTEDYDRLWHFCCHDHYENLRPCSCTTALCGILLHGEVTVAPLNSSDQCQVCLQMAADLGWADAGDYAPFG